MRRIGGDVGGSELTLTIVSRSSDVRLPGDRVQECGRLRMDPPMAWEREMAWMTKSKA